jgi:hypothetical protein
MKKKKPAIPTITYELVVLRGISPLELRDKFEEFCALKYSTSPFDIWGTEYLPLFMWTYFCDHGGLESFQTS